MKQGILISRKTQWVRKMSEIQNLSNRLNEISEKITSVGDLLGTLVDSVNTMGNQLQSTMGELTSVVSKYASRITESSAQEFEFRRGRLSRLFQELEIMKEKIGFKPLQEAGAALNELLDMIDTVAFDPQEIVLKLNDIKSFLVDEIKERE